MSKQDRDKVGDAFAGVLGFIGWFIFSCLICFCALLSYSLSSGIRTLKTMQFAVKDQ